MLTNSNVANPELPTTGFWILPALYVAFVIAIIVTIIRSKNHTGLQKAIWALIVIVAPVLGPLLWLAIGRTQHTNAPR